MREREEEPLTPAELELGEALARLIPAATTLDPARIHWEAQRRRASRQAWLWRGVAAVLALALGLSLLFRPQARTVERLVYVAPPIHRDVHSALAGLDQPAVQEPSVLPAASLDGGDYLAIRGRVLTFGVRALPPPPPAPAQFAARQTPTAAAAAPVVPGRTLLDWLNPLPRENRL